MKKTDKWLLLNSSLYMLNRVILFDSIFSLFYATMTLKGDPSQKANITKLGCFSGTQSQHRNVSILHPSLLVTYKAVNFCFGTEVPPPPPLPLQIPPPSAPLAPLHLPSTLRLSLLVLPLATESSLRCLCTSSIACYAYTMHGTFIFQVAILHVRTFQTEHLKQNLLF